MSTGLISRVGWQNRRGLDRSYEGPGIDRLALDGAIDDHEREWQRLGLIVPGASGSCPTLTSPSLVEALRSDARRILFATLGRVT